MKNIYKVSALLALAVLFGCVPDHRNDNLPDSAVYFVDNAANNGVQNVTMYDVQSVVESPVYVYCSGYNGGTPAVSVSVAEDYIEYYNKINGTELKALPADYYTVLNTTATVSGRKATFNVKYETAALFEFAETENLSDYVLALKLDSKDVDVATVKDTTSLGYCLFRPDLQNAVVKISGVSLDHAAKQAKVLVELPFENQWDFSFEFDYDVNGNYGLDTERGNSIAAKYVCTPMPAALSEQVTVEGGDLAMGPGTNSREYTLTLPTEFDFGEWKKGTTRNFAVSLKNAKLVVDGEEKSVPVEGAALLASYPSANPLKLIKTANNYEGKGFPSDVGQYFRTTLTEYGMDWYQYPMMSSFVWDPESSQDTYLDRFYNGNGYGWKGSWSGAIGPRNKIPQYVHIDMKEARQFSGMVWWRRGDGNVGDTRKLEIYALDDCTYTWKGSNLTYAPDAITYLGSVDFGPREDAITIAAVVVEPIQTQHIMIWITESTRSNATDCAELELWF